MLYQGETTFPTTPGTCYIHIQESVDYNGTAIPKHQTSFWNVLWMLCSKQQDHPNHLASWILAVSTRKSVIIYYIKMYY